MMGTLHEQLCSWENLLTASHKAARGKRGIDSTASFEYALADRLIELQDALRTFTYQPGDYTHFFIHEPKRRKISAAPFRDRVIHHALCNVIEPLFERRFIFDSYANRKGKGTHAAIDRLQYFAQRYRFVLRLDIVQHFASIDHQILKDTLFRIVEDEDVRWLTGRIIDSGAGVLRDEYRMVYFPGDDLFAATRPRGLPIGNLTSQFWSNCYLDPFDHFVKRHLRCKAYLRYVDDFALFSDDSDQLYRWKQAIIARLQALRLTIHEAQAQIALCEHGIPWLGWVVYPTHRKLKARNVVAFTRRLHAHIRAYQQQSTAFAQLNASLQGWINHVRYGDTWRLRTYLFRPIPLQPLPLFPS
jgi:retron-type reverse transcriptase